MNIINNFNETQSKNLLYLAKPIYGGWVTFTAHLSKKYDLQLIPFLLEGVAQKAEFKLSDGMHPNDKGTIIISNTLKKIILKNM